MSRCKSLNNLNRNPPQKYHSLPNIKLNCYEKQHKNKLRKTWDRLKTVIHSEHKKKMDPCNEFRYENVDHRLSDLSEMTPAFRQRLKDWEMWKLATGKVRETSVSEEELEELLPLEFSRLLKQWRDKQEDKLVWIERQIRDVEGERSRLLKEVEKAGERLVRLRKMKQSIKRREIHSSDEEEESTSQSTNSLLEEPTPEVQTKDASTQTIEEIVKVEPVFNFDEDDDEDFNVFVPTKRTIFKPVELVPNIFPSFSSSTNSFVLTRRSKSPPSPGPRVVQMTPKICKSASMSAPNVPPRFPKMGKIPVWCSPIAGRRRLDMTQRDNEETPQSSSSFYTNLKSRAQGLLSKSSSAGSVRSFNFKLGKKSN